MSADRELIEFAASAAGFRCGHHLNDGGWYVRDDVQEIGFDWNPLAKDRDALRLAVKLGLTICNEHESAGVVYCTRADCEDFPVVSSGEMGDPHGITNEDYAATRRAIVLAAAEIGKTKP